MKQKTSARIEQCRQKSAADKLGAGSVFSEALWLNPHSAFRNPHLLRAFASSLFNCFFVV